MSDDQPAHVYSVGGITNYRASGLLTCPRAAIYARQGHPRNIPKPMQAAFDYGTEHEEAVVEMLHRRGYNVFAMQAETDLQITETVHIVGHIDGIADSCKATPIPRSLIEIKCLNHDNTEKFLNEPASFPYYIAQVSAYFHGLNSEPDNPPIEQVIFAIWDKDESQLHIATFKGVWTFAQLKKHVLDLELVWAEYQGADNMPSCTKTTFCPYWQLHEDETETINDERLEAELATYAALKKRIESLEHLQKIVTNRTKDYITGKGYSKGRVGGFKFTYSSFTSERLNTVKVKKLIKELDRTAEFITETPGTRLVVERIEDAV